MCMAKRPLDFTVGEFYHLYNRGVDKRKIFFSEGDWKHFQKLLFLCNSTTHFKHAGRIQKVSFAELVRNDETLVDIVVYAMMPNHFHLLVREHTQGGITKFMQRLLTAFSMYMNKKYDRTGPLMCRPFRAKHVDTDEYFRWLVSYIHSNPIEIIEEEWKQKMVREPKEAAAFLKSFEYSSYPDYFVADRAAAKIINKAALPVDIKSLYSIENMIKALDNQS